jgi:GNAT superfamily N-acetyltransferase
MWRMRLLVRISVRSAELSDVPSIARIHVAAWHHAYRGLVPDEALETRTIERRLEQWERMLQGGDELVLVGCDEAQLVQGFASATLKPGDGFESYLETLYVAPEMWGRGIGRTLLASIAAATQTRGATSMALRTLRLGTARTFYERLGARLVPEGISHDHGALDTVVLAFDNLATLIERVNDAMK